MGCPPHAREGRLRRMPAGGTVDAITMGCVMPLTAKRRRARLVVLLACVCLLLAGACVVPCRADRIWWFTCRLCGVTKTREVVSFFGIPVSKTVSQVRRDSRTATYQSLIGIAHEHEWAGGSYMENSRMLWGGGGGIDGMHAVAPYPVYQPALTTLALEAVESVSHWRHDGRLALFRAALACTDRPAFEDFRSAFHAGSEEQLKAWLEGVARSPKGAGI